MFQNILKEINLYLKSYEDENEDSDWDSDDECAAVSICTDLKKVIEEKANLTSEISAVEKELVTEQSAHGDDKYDSGKHSFDNFAANNNKSDQSDTSKRNSSDSIDYDVGLKDTELSSSENKMIQQKRSHFVHKTASFEVFDDKKEELAHISTKLNSEGNTPKHSYAQMRRYESGSANKIRSSSIQSLRSSTQGNTKKSKKKSNNLNDTKIQTYSSDSNSGSSNSDNDKKSNRSRSSRGSVKRKLENRRPNKQVSKGLSSFAKNKPSKVGKKGKVKKYNKKTISNENPFLIPMNKGDQPKDSKFIKFPKISISNNDLNTTGKKYSAESKKNIDDEKPKRLESGVSSSTKEEYKITGNSSTTKNLFVTDDVDLDTLDEKPKPTKIAKKPSAKDRRAMYHKNPNRNSAIAHKVNDFVNIFDAFAEDELVPVRKPRKSSDNLKLSQETQSLDKNKSNRSKFKSNVDMHKYKFPLGKSKHLPKHISRSLQPLCEPTDLRKGIKR